MLDGRGLPMSHEQIREDYLRRGAEGENYPPPRRFTPADLARDRHHLRTLSTWYFVAAIPLGVAGLVSVWYVLILTAILIMEAGTERGKSLEEMCVAIGVMAVISLLIWALFGGVVTAARALRAHKRYLFCVVMATLIAAVPPLGTLLGVFTNVVLVRDSVKELFTHGDGAFAADEDYA
jgi:hypothetical protein